MKRFFLFSLVFAALSLTCAGQQTTTDRHKAVQDAIQNTAYYSPSDWMESYAALQQREMPYFARDTFTLTWRMDPNNLVLTEDSTTNLIRAIFNPTWPNGGTSPLPERYELGGQTCKLAGGPGVFLEDLDLQFTLDQELEILDVIPLISVRKDGHLRQLNEVETEGVDLSECLKVTLLGEEARHANKVGIHHRTVKKMLQRTQTESEFIAQIIDRAVREQYAGFRILTIETCYDADRSCWFHHQALSQSLTTYGRITAATGPKELFFEAIVHFPEGEDPQVDYINIFK